MKIKQLRSSENCPLYETLELLHQTIMPVLLLYTSIIPCTSDICYNKWQSKQAKLGSKNITCRCRHQNKTTKYRPLNWKIGQSPSMHKYYRRTLTKKGIYFFQNLVSSFYVFIIKKQLFLTWYTNAPALEKIIPDINVQCTLNMCVPFYVGIEDDGDV